MRESKPAYLPFRRNLAPDAVWIGLPARRFDGTGSHHAKSGVVVTKASSSPSLKTKQNKKKTTILHQNLKGPLT